MIPANLARKEFKRLTTSGERVNVSGAVGICNHSSLLERVDQKSDGVMKDVLGKLSGAVGICNPQSAVSVKIEPKV